MYVLVSRVTGEVKSTWTISALIRHVDYFRLRPSTGREKIRTQSMQKSVKFILIGMASLVALLAAIVTLVLFLPESPTEIEHLGAFDVYRFHYSSIGEPGHSRKELWYRGKQLAQDPALVSLNPAEDKIIFVNAMDSAPGRPPRATASTISTLKTKKDICWPVENSLISTIAKSVWVWRRCLGNRMPPPGLLMGILQW